MPQPVQWFKNMRGALGLLLALCVLAPVAHAEENGSYKTYAQWVPKRIGGPFPDNTATIKPQKSASLPDAYYVFWRATRYTESNGKHYRRDGLPLPGGADCAIKVPKGTKCPQDKLMVLSIGYSQARFDGSYGRGNFNDAKPFSPYLASTSWDYNRYLWDPTYNAAIGDGLYTKYMQMNNNNPCAAYVSYNAGPTRGPAYTASGYKTINSAAKTHLANWVANAKRVSGTQANEVAKILQTTPGCTGAMEDVKPMLMAATPAPEPTPGTPSTAPDETPVVGYCAPEATQILVAAFKAEQKDRDDTLLPLYRKIKTESSLAGDGTSSFPSGGFGGGLGDVGACVNLSWPTIQFSWPTMDQIIRAAEKAIINKACDAARKAVNDIKSPLENEFYFNPRIPGVPSAGLDISYPPPSPPPATPAP